MDDLSSLVVEEGAAQGIALDLITDLFRALHAETNSGVIEEDTRKENALRTT